VTAVEIAQALDGRRDGDGYRCRCILADEHKRGDLDPSLSVCDSPDGKLLVKCRTRHRDEQDRIIAALKARGLWTLSNGNGARSGSGAQPQDDAELLSIVPADAPDVDGLAQFVIAKKFADKKVTECFRFDYRDAEDRWRFSTLRFEYDVINDDGTTRVAKDILPAVVGRNKSTGRVNWYSKWPPAPRTLYSLEILAKRPDRAALLLEGEAKTDKANALADFNYVSVSYSAGSARVKESDFSPLATRHVIDWPDNDEPGFKAAIEAAHLIEGAQGKVRGAITDSVLIVKPSSDWPLGFDIKNLIERGWTAAAIDEFIRGNSMSVDTFEDYARERFPKSNSQSADEKSRLKGYSWDAIPAPEFIAMGDATPETLIQRLAMPGMMTLISGTRGLGKTNLGLSLAVAAATGGNFLGQELRAMRVLYLNRDNPTALLRKRLKAWGAGNAPNLKILGRDKAAPFTAKDVWEKFPLNEYDLVIVDSQSAFLEAVDEKEGGVNGDAIASVLDAATTETAFIILSNTKRTGRAYRGSGVIADRADITYEARDATDLKHDARKEWFECLPDPSDEEWLARTKRRKGRKDYRVAFICSKFRDSDEPDPFCVEVCHDDDAGWSCREVTDEVVAKHEEVRGAAAKRREDREAEAVAALKTALPLPKNPDAFDVLKAHGIQRNRARKLIDERTGQDWQVTGSGRKKDPIMLVPVSADAAVNPDDADGLRCPCGHAQSEHSDYAHDVEGRMLYMWQCSQCVCSCGPYSQPHRFATKEQHAS
jgi:hypothetical protein